MALYVDMMAQDIPFSEKVKQGIQMKMEQTAELSQEFFIDLHKNAHPKIKAYFDQKLQDVLKIMLQDYKKAQKKGEIRADIKPEFILYFINHMFDMVKDDELQKIYASPQDLIMELTKFFFYGILPRENG